MCKGRRSKQQKKTKTEWTNNYSPEEVVGTLHASPRPDAASSLVKVVSSSNKYAVVVHCLCCWIMVSRFLLFTVYLSASLPVRE